MIRTVDLYTHQRIGHDITRLFAPLPDYSEVGGAYHDLAQYLSWPTWIWTMPTLADFDNDWFDGGTSGATLWRLSVPAAAVRWVGLNAQCEQVTPVRSWFYDSAAAVRRAGDIPQGLIQAPIRSEWVIAKVVTA